jgi:hypothetical protein
MVFRRGPRTRLGGVDRIDCQSIIPLSYTKCNTIDAAQRRHFLFSPQEFSQTKRRPPHPWCVDGVDAPGWGLVQPQAERFASTLGGRRAVMLSPRLSCFSTVLLEVKHTDNICT